MSRKGSVRHEARLTSGVVPVYYDYLYSANTSKPTVVMIHGGTQSGACYLRTATGRPGWAYRFAEQGYRVAIPDWPGIGRSRFIQSESLTGRKVCEGLGDVIYELPGPVILVSHSMSGAFGWFLAGAHHDRISTVIAVSPAPPGDMQVVPKIANENETEIALEGLHRPWRIPKGDFQPDMAFVQEKMISNSKYFPRDKIGVFAASLLPIPYRLLYERWNISNSQLKIGDPKILRDKRVLVLTGTEDLDHSREVDGAIVTWLQEAGIPAEFLYLGDHNIMGNGHMLMIENNSDAVADLMLDWLAAKDRL